MSDSTDRQQVADVPLWAKTGLVALFVIVILSFYLFFGDSDESTDLAPVDTVQVKKENVLAEPLSMEGMDKNNSSLLVVDNLPSTNLEDELLEYGAEILAIQESVRINNQQISLILGQLKKIQTKFDLDATQKAAQEVALKNINDSIATIEKTLAKQAEVYTKKIKAKKIYKRKVRRVPPFVLVSIDQWGEDTLAIVRYQNHLRELRKGESLSKWVVKSINMDNTTTFRHTSGVSKTLHIKS